MAILTFLVSVAVLIASIFTIIIGVDKLSVKIRRWNRQRAAKKHQASPRVTMEQKIVQRQSDAQIAKTHSSKTGPFPKLH